MVGPVPRRQIDGDWPRRQLDKHVAEEFREVLAGGRGRLHLIVSALENLAVAYLAVFLAQRRLIAEIAMSTRLPTMFGQRDFVEAGGFMSYGENGRDFFHRAAYFVDKIFKGAKPADLPVEQPTRFLMVINLKTAKALGLTVPPSLLARADEVIE